MGTFRKFLLTKDARERAYFRTLAAHQWDSHSWEPTKESAVRRSEYVGVVRAGEYADYYVALEIFESPASIQARQSVAPKWFRSEIRGVSVDYISRYIDHSGPDEAEMHFFNIENALAHLEEQDVEWMSPTDSYNYFYADPPLAPEWR